MKGLNLNSHNNRNEDSWTQALQENIGQGFKDRIGDEEDREGRIVFASSHLMQLLLQASDLCIANIGPVEECQEIEHAQL